MSTEPLRWSEMSPRERDALVAIKIFGTPVEHLTQREARFTNEEGEEEVHELLTGYVTMGKFGYELIPHYTTSMDAAWQVMQHMAALFNPKDPYGYEPFHRFTHDLFDTDNEELYPSYRYMANEVANWTPEKICLIALRAVGVAIEE